MSYKLRTPCAECPFRTDIPGYLRRERAIEISESIADGAEFPCHKTTVPDPSTDFEMVKAAHSQFCAGALIMMEKMEAPNQIVRIAERVGAYDATRMDMDAPVARSYFEFIDHHTPEDYEDNTCSYSGQGCEAPAGHMHGMTAIPGADADYELSECPGCGEKVCDNCLNGGDLCPNCADYEGE